MMSACSEAKPGSGSSLCSCARGLWLGQRSFSRTMSPNTAEALWELGPRGASLCSNRELRLSKPLWT